MIYSRIIGIFTAVVTDSNASGRSGGKARFWRKYPGAQANKFAAIVFTYICPVGLVAPGLLQKRELTPMVAATIRLVLSKLPAFLLVAAFVIAILQRNDRNFVERLLDWLLLLPIGVSGIWGGLFHVFLPQIAASDIGWQPSPFQFEVGMADFALGVTACVAFHASLPFKAATILANAIFLLGDAVGHVVQMISSGNFASGNAGVPFWTDILVPALAIVALLRVRQRRGI